MQLELSDQEIEFYSRQLLVSGWGLKQQLALKNSIVVLSYENDLLALYLAGAGVGEIIYEKNAEKIKKLNPNIRISSKINKANKTEACSTDCKMACCAKKKEASKSCSTDCKKDCCTA